MIKLQVIGHLGKDCQVNTVNGKSVINFSVAHSERFKDSQGVQQERTTWVECAYWTDRTAVAPYLTKGTQVYVEGQPDIRVYQRNDGSTGASITIRVREVQLLGGRKDGGQPGTYNQGPSVQSGNQTVSAADLNAPADDLPF
jgi:single-strand DNA-binding protein